MILFARKIKWSEDGCSCTGASQCVCGVRLVDRAGESEVIELPRGEYEEMKAASVKPTTWLMAVLVAILICSVSGCSARKVAVAQGHGVVPNPPATRTENLERLAALHKRRAVEGNNQEYILGSGDVLALRAFGFDELNRRVRVDGDGTITLPLLETVSVGGRTISAVQKDLTERLAGYMYDPHVSVFVDEYRSHQVAVVGAVSKPGLVTLTSQESSVLDALSAAGGVTAGHSGRIYLIPGEGRARIDMNALADQLNRDKALAQDAHLTPAQLASLNDAMPLMLDINQVPKGVESLFFSLPVRAGDVIMVPSSGQFIIDGWVEKPGTYPLRPGLTLRGALATAGGLAFPAKTDSVKIHRLGANGETELQVVSYNDITARRSPDVFIHEGDVIEVATSSTKVVPYTVWKMASELVRFGAGIRFVP